MDEFNASYAQATKYPQNLINIRRYNYVLNGYYSRLNQASPGLFGADTKAAVCFLQINADEKSNFIHTCCTALYQLCSNMV